MVQYGITWYSMLWYGMVWYGMVCMVWYGMVWYGMVAWYGITAWYGMSSKEWEQNWAPKRNQPHNGSRAPQPLFPTISAPFHPLLEYIFWGYVSRHSHCFQPSEHLFTPSYKRFWKYVFFFATTPFGNQLVA